MPTCLATHGMFIHAQRNDIISLYFTIILLSYSKINNIIPQTKIYILYSYSEKVHNYIYEFHFHGKLNIINQEMYICQINS